MNLRWRNDHHDGQSAYIGAFRLYVAAAYVVSTPARKWNAYFNGIPVYRGKEIAQFETIDEAKGAAVAIAEKTIREAASLLIG